MAKYYICNDISFLSGMNRCNNPSSGSYKKMSEANSFIKLHPEYSYYKVRRTTKKGNDYVICTRMKFVGNDCNIVDSITKAKSFDSVEDAYRFFDNNHSVWDKDVCFVIDEKFVKKNRPGLIREKCDDITATDVYRCGEKVDTSERILIPSDVKDELYKKSGGVCAICGKAISKYNYTIDHVMPLSRGGTNTPENLRVVHKDCNRFKGSFTDKELVKNSANVICNGVHQAPTSGVIAQIFRASVRGIINRAGGL